MWISEFESKKTKITPKNCISEELNWRAGIFSWTSFEFLKKCFPSPNFNTKTKIGPGFIKSQDPD
jgi:hypothetical protein